MAKKDKKANKKVNKESNEKVVDIKSVKKGKTDKEVVAPTAKEKKASKAVAVKEEFEGKYSKPSKSMAAITKAIESKEMQGVKSAIEIGGLLQDAKFYFPNGKGDVDGKAWLGWAEEAFDYRKAQAHNLVKINEVFADNEVMIDLKPSVLIALTRNVEMLEAATEAVTKGDDVDTKWGSEWRTANLPAPKVKGEGSDGDGSDGDGESSSAKQREKDDKFIQSLEDKIESLEAKLKELEKSGKGGKKVSEAALAEAVEKEVARVVTLSHAAVLKHISKLSPNLILGLKESSTARQINQAVTALDKIYGSKSETPSAEIMEVIKAAQGAMKE